MNSLDKLCGVVEVKAEVLSNDGDTAIVFVAEDNAEVKFYRETESIEAFQKLLPLGSVISINRARLASDAVN